MHAGHPAITAAAVAKAAVGSAASDAATGGIAVSCTRACEAV